ncbi:hypothetical protein, partial [Streptacidiphilus griseoplanus]|uniref:hypothetical protein n=1 Tax=Peterkaempfera griseoplana TaxID=66896 RepID=UPI000A7F73CC
MVAQGDFLRVKVVTYTHEALLCTRDACERTVGTSSQEVRMRVLNRRLTPSLTLAAALVAALAT